MNSAAYENSIILQIDEKTRSITNDGKNTPIILGVKGDDCAERVYFHSPRYLSPEIDLLDETDGVEIHVFVDYKNASHEPYIQECSAVVAEGDTGNVSFSWLVTNKATNTKGDVKFNVCVKKFIDGKQTNEWHTTTFTGKVLEGVDVTNKTPEVITHESVTIQALATQVENYTYAYKELTEQLAEVSTYVDGIMNAAMDSKLVDYPTYTDLEAYATKNTVETVFTGTDSDKISPPNTTDGYNFWGIELSKAPTAGSILRIYIGSSVEEYKPYMSFVMDLQVIQTPGGALVGQASHFILLNDPDAWDTCYEAVVHAYIKEETDNRLFFSAKVYHADQQTVETTFGTDFGSYTIEKVELITGPNV